MKNIYLGLILIAVFTNALAEINSNKPYNLICAEEQSTGFNWRSNGWEKTNYKSYQYIIKKLTGVKDVFPIFCKEITPLKPNPGSFAFSNSCYSVTQLGEIPEKIGEFPVGQSCYETWIKDTASEGYILQDVKCSNIKFKPNGWFHKSKIDSSVENNVKEKGSLIISVGKCSKI